MEYRIFQEIDRGQFQNTWTMRPNIRHRTDIYFILPLPKTNTEDLCQIQRGLKLRGQRSLEVKTRLERRKNGQELWKKTVQVFKRFDIQDLKSIRDVLRHWHQSDLADQLESSPPEFVCYVEKYLQGKTSCERGTLESTGLCLQFVRRTDQCSIGPKLYFETFCFETSSLIDLSEKYLRDIFPGRTLESSNAMGYPEFLWKQYKTIVQST